MTLMPRDPLDPDAPGLDNDVRRGRRILADMKKLSPEELFQQAVRAGIFTPAGELTEPYKDDHPSPYRDALTDNALDFPILDVLRSAEAGGPMHHESVVEALRQRWVVSANEVLGRLRRMVAAGFLVADPPGFSFSLTETGRQAQPAR